MDGEGACRHFLTAFWVLLRTAGSGAPDVAVAAAAAPCAGALRTAIADETHFVLQERAGALYANGARIRPGIDSFSAIAGLTDLLRGRGIGQLLLMAATGADDLFLLARCWHAAATAAALDAALQARGCQRIHVGPGDTPAAAAPPPAAVATEAASGSQIGVVYSLQQFATDLAGGPLGGRRARAALQAVLQGLLRSPRGLAPLARLQQDGRERAIAARASVLAVRTAEELCWPAARCTGAGIAALLGQGADGGADAEVAALAAASRSVAASLAGPGEPAATMARLQQGGGLTAEVAAAMTSALAIAG